MVRQWSVDCCRCQGNGCLFYEAGAVRPPVAVVFVFLVCGDVVVVSIMTEVYARRRGGARSVVVAVKSILILK